MEATSTITIKVDGKDREVFMSYGLLNQLTTKLATLEDIPLLLADHALRNQVLNVLLSERSPTGKVISEVDIDDVEISLEDVEKLIAWAQEHLFGFFLRAATNLVSAATRIQGVLTPSSSGTSGSPSMTQSAGSST